MRARQLVQAITLMALLPVPGAAETPSREPGVLQATKAAVEPGDRIIFECSDGGDPHITAFTTDIFAYTFHRNDGTLGESFMIAGSGHSGAYATVRAGEHGVEHGYTNPDWWNYTHSNRFANMVDEPGVVRILWAAWGQDGGECDFTLNGVTVPAERLDPSAATYAIVTDFESVAVSSTAGYAGLSGAYEREADGYLVAMFAPGVGAVRVEGPGGETTHATGRYPWITVTQPTSGLWRFSFDYVADDIGGPLLWFVEMA